MNLSKKPPFSEKKEKIIKKPQQNRKKVKHELARFGKRTSVLLERI